MSWKAFWLLLLFNSSHVLLRFLSWSAHAQALFSEAEAASWHFCSCFLLVSPPSGKFVATLLCELHQNHCAAELSAVRQSSFAQNSAQRLVCHIATETNASRKADKEAVCAVVLHKRTFIYVCEWSDQSCSLRSTQYKHSIQALNTSTQYKHSIQALNTSTQYKQDTLDLACPVKEAKLL